MVPSAANDVALRDGSAVHHAVDTKLPHEHPSLNSASESMGSVQYGITGGVARSRDPTAALNLQHHRIPQICFLECELCVSLVLQAA